MSKLLRTIRETRFRFALPIVILAAGIFSFAQRASAQQQFQGVCAQVRMEIAQQLTLERIGFLATLTITNNIGDGDLTNFSATLTFENPQLSTETDTDDSSSLFFVQPPTINGISGIDGTGILPPGQTATISWFIIPTPTAGGELPTGVEYEIGVDLGASFYGDPLPATVLQVFPDTITVRPEPQLEIRYFQPRDVAGDNPFTPDVVEAPIPFTLGVLVNNVGFGPANNLQIDSGQPEIVSNEQGLLLVAQLLGSRVDDEPTDFTSLLVDMGTIIPGGCRKAAWDMITSLSGEFTEFEASFTHASELGGEETSLITLVEAHFLTHEVRNDRPGQDALTDFLADVDRDPLILPDTLFTTDCDILPVNVLTNVSVNGSGLTATVTAQADFEDWVYMQVTDPAQAMLPIASVVRSDGKVLDPNNYWTNFRFDPITNARLNYLNLFDYVDLGNYTYNVTYTPIANDVIPPVTTLRFAGEFEEIAPGTVVVTPDTQLYFTVEDQSPVSIQYDLNSSGMFVPGLPFTLDAGTYLVEYFSEDNQGNVEMVKSTTVISSDAAPNFSTFDLASTEFVQSGPALTVRPGSLSVTITKSPSSGATDVDFEVFDRIQGYPRVDGVPSSPTTSPSASLVVSGPRADFYKYGLNGGAWSPETPVATPISLAGLVGDVEVRILARNAEGAYPDEAEALLVEWVVDPLAPSYAVAQTDAFPLTDLATSFTVSGADEYKYMLDLGPLMPTTPVATPIDLTDLDEGVHTIRVIGRNGSDPFPDLEEAVELTFLVDRNYGTELGLLEKIRTETFEDIDTDPVTFDWDGRDDMGVLQPSGWYSLRTTIRDNVGRRTARVDVIRINDLAGGAALAPDASNPPQLGLSAAAGWAVWQDQRSGDFDIFALDLGSLDPEFVVGQTTRNQTNPRTDGARVVWEERREDGGVDIAVADLASGALVTIVTDTASREERSPVIWRDQVVYRARAANDPAAPWQLFRTDLGTMIETPIDPTTQDQLAPEIDGEWIVWQDLRDAGAGEIYAKNWSTSEIRRLTDDLFGQFDPVVADGWFVWSDSRNGQLDLYGQQIEGGIERRLTDTPENEAQPSANGSWIVYREDALGVLRDNLRLLDLASSATAQLTNSASRKFDPVLTAGRLLWRDLQSGVPTVLIGTLPSLRAAHDNIALIPVTQGMVDALGDAQQLLTLWQQQVGVESVTQYTELVPIPIAETLTWDNGSTVGTNFALVAGSFVQVRFTTDVVIDLGNDNCAPVDFQSGTNVLTYSCFPDDYTGFDLISDLGVPNVNAVRILDSYSGRWRIAAVEQGNVVGDDFPIPRSAVIFVDLNTNLPAWMPQGAL